MGHMREILDELGDLREAVKMTDNETYNGWKNRETWAFNLHWQNDQGLYNETLEIAREFNKQTERGENYTPDDYMLGEHVVDYWREYMDATWANTEGDGFPNRTLRMFEREVGSWWRIDYAEVGAAVRESLDNES